MDPPDLPIELEYLSEEEKMNNYKLKLQDYIRQLKPTGYLVGKKGSYRQDELFKIREKIKKIESNFASDFDKNRQFNNNHEISLLISNIEQVILAYESLMNNTARELNIKIFKMPWDKIISGEINLLNPEIDLSNPFTVRSITRRSGGRTKKRRNKKRRTLRRKPHYK
jgi:hypothetical protein